MREHRHHATDHTIAALRRLRRPWAGYHVAADALRVALQDGGRVTIRVEAAELEPSLTAVRLTAAADDGSAAAALPGGVAAAAFAAGGNDVVVFRSETWIEASDAARDGDPVVQFTGSPLQRSSSAVAVCAVDDAVVVATTAGTGLLVRCGLRPDTLEVTDDPAAIAAFLRERQYLNAGPAEGA